MKKSALQTARASYQPKLPEAIKNRLNPIETQTLSCQKFPLISLSE